MGILVGHVDEEGFGAFSDDLLKPSCMQLCGIGPLILPSNHVIVSEIEGRAVCLCKIIPKKKGKEGEGNGGGEEGVK